MPPPKHPKEAQPAAHSQCHPAESVQVSTNPGGLRVPAPGASIPTAGSGESKMHSDSRSLRLPPGQLPTQTPPEPGRAPRHTGRSTRPEALGPHHGPLNARQPHQPPVVTTRRDRSSQEASSAGHRYLDQQLSLPSHSARSPGPPPTHTTADPAPARGRHHTAPCHQPGRAAWASTTTCGTAATSQAASQVAAQTAPVRLPLRQQSMLTGRLSQEEDLRQRPVDGRRLPLTSHASSEAPCPAAPDAQDQRSTSPCLHTGKCTPKVKQSLKVTQTVRDGGGP